MPLPNLTRGDRTLRTWWRAVRRALGLFRNRESRHPDNDLGLGEDWIEDFLSVHTSLTGKKLAHYQILENIGEGITGAVYLAHDTRLKREVAIKVLRAFPFAPGSKRRFLQEAQHASSLNDPHIVTIYSLDRFKQFDFIVMEFVRGKNLAEVRSAGRISLQNSLSYAIQIVEGLATAHSRRIIHRDIKPSNILVTQEDHIKIVDFGLAKAITDARRDVDTEKTEDGTIVGTFAYMSPEQARGEAADARSDVFSFGVVFYEMLTGERAFKRRSVADTLQAVQFQNVPERPPEVPVNIWTIVTRCLEKERAARYPDAGAVAEALRSAQSDAPLNERRRPIVPKLRIRRSTLLVGGGIAALIATLLFWPVRRPDSAPMGRILSASTSEGRIPDRMVLPYPTDSMVLSHDGQTLFATARTFPNAGKLLVVNLRSRTVDVISLSTDGGPLALSPSGTLYIGSRVEGILAFDTKIYDLDPNPIPTHGPVWDMAITPDGQKLFLAMGRQGVKRLAVRTRELRQIATQACPENLELDREGRRLYVAYQCSGPGGRPGHDALETFDAESEESISTFSGPPMVGGDPSVSPDSRVLTLDGEDACQAPAYDHQGCPFVPSHIIYLFGSREQKVLQTFPLPDGASGPARFLDNTRFFALGDTLSVVDTTNHSETETWAQGPRYFNHLVQARGRRLLILGSTLTNELLFLYPESSTCSLPQDGLVDFYPGDGTFADVANNTDLTPEGQVTFAAGKVGQAFFFDGAGGDLVGSPIAHYTFGPQDSTLAMYAKFAGLQGEMTLWHRMAQDHMSGISLVKSEDNRFVFSAATSQGLAKLTSSKGAVENRWYHVMITKTDHDLVLYVNGQLEDRQSLTSPLKVPIPTDIVTRLRLGAGSRSSGSLHGWLDEIALYNRAFTSDEVRSFYQMREVGPCRT